MGHHSIAEHAVFNFDLIDVSRLALEEIEKFRLSSYTEKSQRYQKLEDNFILPEEFKGSKHESSIIGLINDQNRAYQQMVSDGIEPEDARYVTSMATCGQVGMTMNARNLELLVRRFASSHLAEVRELGKQIFDQASRISPSLILFTAANDFDQKTYPGMKAALKGKWERKRRVSAACELVDHTSAADIKLVATLIHSSTAVSYRNSLRLARSMNKPQRQALVKKAFERMEFYDSTLREFEHISLTYDLVLSSACFAQMKRHRMATITAQDYEPALGVTIPPKIKEQGKEKYFKEMIAQTDKLYNEIKGEYGAAAQYLLTGAHRRRILMSLNARELYHVSRLREDLHAQWDIQQLTGQMTAAASKVMPLAMQLIGGKDSYPEKYSVLFGHAPKILPPKE
jgi:thymidylate synthase ThyX